MEDFVNHIKKMGLYYRGNKEALNGIEQESDDITFHFRSLWLQCKLKRSRTRSQEIFKRPCSNASKKR